MTGLAQDFDKSLHNDLCPSTNVQFNEWPSSDARVLIKYRNEMHIFQGKTQSNHSFIIPSCVCVLKSTRKL